MDVTLLENSWINHQAAKGGLGDMAKAPCCVSWKSPECLSGLSCD